ncbi:unnamed protein product [Paramecium pentaurelia]|uniref:Transmembrane protein n=1 Tax=Paramecium pentaurelia TaxID=43138 RepID=A0A8S1Y9Q5_9CILI|nr:unnamed protein product [Paramecium pentaurelia]
MNIILNAIQKIDVFGVPIFLLTNNNNPLHQSKLGGIVTLSLGSISLFYFFYVIILWMSYSIAPNISSKQQTLGYTEFQLQDSTIQISLQDFSGDIDPFQKENNIITPLLFTYKDKTIYEKPIALFSSQEQPYLIKLNNASLILNTLEYKDEKYQEQRQYLIVLARCSEVFAINGSNCADENTINTYLSKYHGFLFLNIKLSQLNYITQEFEYFNKLYYTSFDVNMPQYSQILLKQQETIIDSGIVFNNFEHFSFLNNYEFINQVIDNSFSQKIINSMSNFTYNFDSYGCYLIRIDNISIKEEITHPKLGQILAQIGSIVQLIFLLKHLLLYYNTKLLENELLNEIITMYYPEFKEFKLDIFNQFNISFYKNNNQFKSSNLQEKYLILQARAKEKCKLNNILYEISRIQFILQQKFGDMVLIQSHQMGAKIDLNQIALVSIKESNRLCVKPVESIDLEPQSQNIDPLELLIKQS